MSREIVKIVITGPVNAGKTTLIQHISDTPVICTDEIATDEVAGVKKHTTVAMDHGILHVDDSLELHLYGTPGQRRFDFMWDILAVGAAGIIFLVDGSDPKSIDEMNHIFRYFRDRHSIPSLVGVTRQDLDGAANVEEVARQLGADSVPVIGCDPRKKEDSKVLILSLFELIIQEKEEVNAEDFF